MQTSDQNKIEVTACRFNDLNQKKEIEMHPEKKISRNDFFVSFLHVIFFLSLPTFFFFKVCDVCQITINKTENSTYKVVEMECVLHDSRTYIRAPEV